MSELSGLIEKQIEEASRFLSDAERYQEQGLRRSGELSLIAFCERLLQIVQNQQTEIKELRKYCHKHFESSSLGKAELVKFKRGEEPKW